MRPLFILLLAAFSGLANAQAWRTQSGTFIDARLVKTAPAISAGVLTLDTHTSNFFNVPLGANITTMTVSNAAASGTVTSFTLLLRAGLAAPTEDGLASRFVDFDTQVVRPVLAVTGHDLRELLNVEDAMETELDEATRAALLLLARWQREWRDAANGKPWRVAELAEAIDAKVIDETGVKLLHRWVSNAKLWDLNIAKALGNSLRTLSGDHKFEPLVIESKLDAHAKVNKWFIDGAGEKSTEGMKF